jgi:hypothetical protein
MNSLVTKIPDVLACSVCQGSDGNALTAANAGVGFMLVILLGVLGSFLGFIVYLARKSREANEAESGSSN